MLDAQAKEAYRRRLAEIEEDIEEAQAMGDDERAAQAAAERDFLVRELARAVGLGGRDRRAGSASERARASVTRASARPWRASTSTIRRWGSTWIAPSAPVPTAPICPIRACRWPGSSRASAAISRRVTWLLRRGRGRGRAGVYPGLAPVAIHATAGPSAVRKQPTGPHDEDYPPRDGADRGR